MPKAAKSSADYILPLYMNGLSGRMLRMPPPTNKKREILFIYGHHTSLERVFGVAEFLNKYGAVTIPDLPGFGGMNSFYKIGEKASLDDYADYLAAFIKLRYRNRRFTLAGYSLGFAFVTRMLQKYPELAKKVDLLVSIAGTTHKSDLVFKKRNIFLIWVGIVIFSRRLAAALARHLILRRFVIRSTYKILEPLFIKGSNSKVRDINKKEQDRRLDFEVHLWQINDFRTYAATSGILFKLNLTGKHVDLPVYHISVDNDRYFDNLKVEQHMRTIYNDFHLCKADVPTHSPSVIASAREAAPFIPPAMRRLLNKKVY